MLLGHVLDGRRICAAEATDGKPSVGVVEGVPDVVERIHKLQAAGGVVHGYEHTLRHAAGRQGAACEVEVLSAA